jgi:hypothetical protein
MWNFPAKISLFNYRCYSWRKSHSCVCSKCRLLCAVRCLIIICFSLLFYNHSTYVFIYSLNVCLIVLFVCFLFCVFGVSVLFCVLFLSSPPVNICLFSIWVHFYRPLPPGGNQIAVNKYHVIRYHIISHHIVMKDVYVVINIRCTTRHFKQTGLQLQPRSVLNRTRHATPHTSHRTLQPCTTCQRVAHRIWN